MRLALAVLVGLAYSAPALGDENPYVLKLDKTPYVLRAPTSGASAAAGATREALRPAPYMVSAPVASGDYQRWRILEQDYELRIADLRRERDAWRLRAETIESELRFYLSTTPVLPRGR